MREIVITNDIHLEKGAVLNARLVIRASHVTIDGNGATLVGPGKVGDPGSLEKAGVGVSASGVSGVTLRNLKAKGFATGLVVEDGRAWQVEECDFSDNYHNPAFDWGELPPRGGILLTRVHASVFRKNRANRVWDGVHLRESDENTFEENDFSRSSNVCARLWTASRNRFLRNNLSYGLRIDRSKGEVHARDSTGVLIESGSNGNYWYRNDVTHGGDGIFIRVLNGWVSTGNLFVENDTSYANNNCIESWSPGNTYIRNKANHGSYGFWLGGSDQTVLIGNEAAYNGLPTGFHNAPEPGFGHGGIVIVKGPASHTVIEGNHCHHNNGAGIAFRGDDATKGERWRTHHWIVQQNDLHDNRWGIWGRWGDWIHLAANQFRNNTQGNFLQEVTRLFEAPEHPEVQSPPVARVRGPEQAMVGQPVVFDASESSDPQGRPLAFRWDLGGMEAESARVTQTFTKPGFYRVGVTVTNGVLASLGFRDLVVVAPVAREFGTEGEAERWGFTFEGDAEGRGRIRFADDPEALVGSAALRFTPSPYPGAYATAVYPATKDARWDLSPRPPRRGEGAGNAAGQSGRSGKTALSFWIKAQNPNLPGWQNAGPVMRLHGPDGMLVYTPARGRNLLADPSFSEARWRWQRIVVPLAGGGGWERKLEGHVTLARIDAVSLSLDSWGYEPFTVWIDGLSFE